MKNLFHYSLGLFFCSLSLHAQQFISFGIGTTTPGSSWKYLDNGTDQGSTWRNASFNDSAWLSGNSELGYGNTLQNTTLSFGPSSTNKYITTYFRKTINIPNAAAFLNYTMNIKRDDGIVVYLNGIQVFINNLTPNPAYNTLASLGSRDLVLSLTIPASQFVSGDNIIAAEIHQATITSSDISFDMELIGSNTPLANNSFDNPKLNITASPNPTTGELKLIANTTKISDVAIFDILGKQVYNSKYNSMNEIVLDLSILQSGVYLVKVTSDSESTETLKIMKI